MSKPINDLTLLLIVLLETNEDVQPGLWRRTRDSLKTIDHDWLVIDRRPIAKSEQVVSDDWNVVRTPGYQLGPDIQDAVKQSSCACVAFFDANSHLHPDSITSALKVLQHQADIDLVLGNTSIGGTATQERLQVSLSGLPNHPPPCWLGAAVFRRTAFNSLPPLSCFPSLLWLYRNLCIQGRAFHLSLDMQQYGRDSFFHELPIAKFTNEWLDRWSEARFDSVPQVAVILMVTGPVSTALPALRALCRQTLPPDQIQVVLVAEGPGGDIRDFQPDLFPVRIDPIRRRTHGLAKAFNKALTQVVAPVVCFCRTDDMPERDWSERHLLAHQSDKGGHLAVCGPTLLAGADSPFNSILNEVMQTRSQHPLLGMSLDNTSFTTRSLQAIGGLTPAQDRPGTGMDLAQRWLQHGYDILHLPQAVVWRTRAPNLEEFRRQERLLGRTVVTTCARHIEAFDRLNIQGLSLQAMQQEFEQFKVDEPTWTHVANSLSSVSLEAMSSNHALMDGHRELVSRLRKGWELLGRIDGLRAHGLADLGELLRQHPLGLTGQTAAPWIVAPMAGQAAEWRQVIRNLLEHSEQRPIVIWPLPNSLLPHEEIIGFAQLARAHAARSMVRTPPSISVLEESPPTGRLIRLLSGAKAIFHWQEKRESDFFHLLELARLEEVTNSMFQHPLPEPWPLATQAEFRLLAWPDWADPSAMKRLFEQYAALIIGKPHCCLCLRLEPLLDPPETEALAALEQAFQCTLSPDDDLQVLLITEELQPIDWARLNHAVSAVVIPAGQKSSPRLKRLRRMRALKIQRPHELVTLLQRQALLQPSDSNVQLLLLNPPSPPTIEHP